MTALDDGQIEAYLADPTCGKWGLPQEIHAAGAEAMRLYLAGNAPWREKEIYTDIIRQNSVCILKSFYYADKWIEKAIPLLKSFMLDSGAFTFFTAGKHVDWNEHVERYADFINRNKVELFFELDIDSLIGYENVLKIRRDLERKTGRQCIPVWHKSRGMKEFLRMCDEYSYVSIGGIVSGEIKRSEYDCFTHFIREAHKRDAKIHGLGFTNLEGIRKYHFDSVDSTAWLSGNRFGSIYKFNGKTMTKIGKKEGQRISDPVAATINNFNEWVKFQRYAEDYL